MLLGERTIASRAYVAGFNFKGSDQQKKVGSLSGGERNRLHMAKLLASGGNLLILDEPTNDLEHPIPCARSRRRCCRLPAAPWSSPMIRWFLDRIATHACWLSRATSPGRAWFVEGNFEAVRELPPRTGWRRGRPTPQLTYSWIRSWARLAAVPRRGHRRHWARRVGTAEVESQPRRPDRDRDHALGCGDSAVNPPVASVQNIRITSNSFRPPAHHFVARLDGQLRTNACRTSARRYPATPPTLNFSGSVSRAQDFVVTTQRSTPLGVMPTPVLAWRQGHPDR